MWWVRGDWFTVYVCIHIFIYIHMYVVCKVSSVRNMGFEVNETSFCNMNYIEYPSKSGSLRHSKRF